MIDDPRDDTAAAEPAPAAGEPEIIPAPRWVKVVGVLAGLLLLVVIVLHLTGNSLGGPGRHGFGHAATDSPSTGR